MSQLVIDQVTKSYDKKRVLDQISFTASSGEFIVLVGPSGCGKSTMLRAIAGLEDVDSGRILIGERDVTDLAPKERNIAMVFQDYALYPHKNVYENIAFGLRIRKIDEDEIDRRVRYAASSLDLSELLERKPSALSGGQRQRVAIGRAIVRKPEVFLFDEPLSNLDAKLRGSMRLTIAKLHKKLNATVVYVTHDQVEAMTLADRIIVLNGGIIQQMGAPIELYDSPVNEFVATFIGSPPMNLISGAVRSEGDAMYFVSQSGEIKQLLPPSAREKLLGQRELTDGVKWGLRAENLKVCEGQGDLAGQIEVVEPLGAETSLYLQVGQDEIHVKTGKDQVSPKVGDRLNIKYESPYFYLFSKDNGRNLTL